MVSNPLKNMSLYAVSLFLMKGISLFTLPLMAHYLSPVQLGQLEFIGITAVFFSMVIGLAMHENLYRFIGTIDCHDTQKRKASELYTATLLISSGLGIACFTLYNLIGAPIESISESQSFLIGIVLCYEAPLAIGLAWLRLHNQAMLFFKLCVTTVIVQVALLVMILFYRPDVTLIFAANVICTLGQFLFLHVYLPFSIRLPSRKQLQSYLRYSSPLMLSAMVAFALSGAERWFIAGYTDLETLGIYAIAAKFALGVGIMIQPFHMWWMPRRFQVQQTQGNLAVAKTIQQGALLLCVIAVALSWASQLFITLALPANYHQAAQLVAITILIMVFKELTEMINIGILHAKQTTKLLSINLVAIFIAFIVGALTIEYGVYAILVALLCGQVSRFLFALIMSQRLLPLPYHTGATLGLIALSSLLVISGSFEQPQSVTLLMFVLQPLALVAYAQRVNLIDIKQVRKQFSTTAAAGEK